MNSNRLRIMENTRNYLVGLGNRKLLLQKERIIDTFPAQHLKEPNTQKPLDSLSEYSLRKNYGLELRRRRRNRSNIKM